MITTDLINSKYPLIKRRLDEKTRRLWAAIEANSIGRGGITVVSNATGLSRTTITAAIKELDEAEESVGKIRRPGGGRRRLTETEPALLEDLEKWLEPVTRGDPESPLRWTCKSTRKLAAELEKQGYRSSDRKVSQLLRQLNYRLQSNRKTTEITSHPDRNLQFEQINNMTGLFQSKGQPVISVDAQKRERIGDFKNAGKEWRPKKTPEKVRRYDFKDEELGHGSPSGVYDITANKGWGSVGIDGNTAELACETIRHWWNKMGVRHDNHAEELLITADGGGSNGSRNRLWKVCLQKLADEAGLKIAVCHFPPGTSKWNKIEHRRFCQITPNWRGKPLVSHETMVSLSGGTTTRKGLKIEAHLDGNKYETGIKISDQELAGLNLERNIFHGEWNYFSSPRTRH
jgi:DNA-binding transcriptional regulator GbsR (MarR family)